ncbi:MAG TPA: hypothetical protein VG028_12690 [Terriglobia bacterium]|nr:hypothetical protein [Terriglobia bacterium]
MEKQSEEQARIKIQKASLCDSKIEDPDLHPCRRDEGGIGKRVVLLFTRRSKFLHAFIVNPFMNALTQSARNFRIPEDRLEVDWIAVRIVENKETPNVLDGLTQVILQRKTKKRISPTSAVP